MMPTFFHFQHTLNRFLNNCKKYIDIRLVLLEIRREEGEEGDGIKLTPSEKTTIKKPSLIRVKIECKEAEVF